jgi:hypothetical protein
MNQNEFNKAMVHRFLMQDIVSPDKLKQLIKKTKQLKERYDNSSNSRKIQSIL